VILPGATLGVVGGGQLGRMFTIRARTMGYRVVVLEPDPRSPAGAIADRQIEAQYDDPGALAELAAACSAVTTEFENVPAHTLGALAERLPVRPAASAVSVAQDRIAEKEHLARAGFPTAPFRRIEDRAAAERAFTELGGGAAILKTSRLGYDGKGQTTIGSPAACGVAFDELGGVECILERRLSLETEVSVVLARGADGAAGAFPPGENRHRNGILDTTIVPARVSRRLTEEARAMALGIADSLEYVGVLGVELFVAEGGRLFVNEIAPRPHNSGHYTIDACISDQFEQQVRTLCGLPLGSFDTHSAAAMVNLLGDLWTSGPPAWDRVLAIPGARLHLYGKAEARPGRKMGHVTCLASTADEAVSRCEEVRAALAG
jgi:5-(carboxyamino)imidazole ribonucleotide synthase